MASFLMTHTSLSLNVSVQTHRTQLVNVIWQWTWPQTPAASWTCCVTSNAGQSWKQSGWSDQLAFSLGLWYLQCIESSSYDCNGTDNWEKHGVFSLAVVIKKLSQPFDVIRPIILVSVELISFAKHCSHPCCQMYCILWVHSAHTSNLQYEVYWLTYDKVYTT